MTMDMNILTSSYLRNTPPSETTTPSRPHPLPSKNTKRSFDVAFLMAPDEKLAERRQEKFRLRSLLRRTCPADSWNATRQHNNNNNNNNNDDDVSFSSEVLVVPKCEAYVFETRHESQSASNALLRQSTCKGAAVPRSAFTKVTSPKLEVPLPTSPLSSLSASPEQIYIEDSLSPSGQPTLSPMLPYPLRDGFHSDIPHTDTPLKHIKTTTLNTNHLAFNHIPSSGDFRNSIDSYLLKSSNMQTNLLGQVGYPGEKDLLSSGFPTRSKLRTSMLYPQPEVMTYSSLAASYPFTTSFPTPSVDLLRPTTSLLSSTFAAFALPAQNVCAKCNVSFRMTSDLVYHMRSHHKGDCSVMDSLRRRRDQDKLKCPVCSESFRERHHLTRHMTAHQDKEGDFQDDGKNGEMGVCESRSGLGHSGK